MAILTANKIEVRDKRVLVRVDYNVPMQEQNGSMAINDDTRIRATLPTLQWLKDNKARIILTAHLGRPKGCRELNLSLRPIAKRLEELLGNPVPFVDECVGDKVKNAVAGLNPGSMILLENLRFHAGEEANDRAFAEQLAEPAEVYLNDAFGAAHRAHASTDSAPRVIAARGGKCGAGLLMERELNYLGKELEDPTRPFIVILGGAKVSDKIKVIDRLLEKADAILIGGAMAYTFKLAQGLQVGRSLVERDKVDIAKSALTRAASRNIPFLLPQDNVVVVPVETNRLDNKGKPIIDRQDPQINTDPDIPEDREGVDIGPASARRFCEVIAGAKTILWNGPMGIFEDPRFAKGTFAVATAVAEASTKHGAKSIVGGGDSVKALNLSGLAEKVTFMSTGGGASLEFLEGRTLPGVAALSND